MNGKDLLEGLNHVEDRYVDEAEYGKLRKRVPVGWISMAACVCLIATVLLSSGGMKTAEDSAMAEAQNNGAVLDRAESGLETYVETSTALGYGETYRYSIDESVFADYVGGKVIEEEKLGEKIGDVTLTAGWHVNSEGTWKTQEALRGEVYAITGVAQEVAVALRFLDKGDAVTLDHYYVLLNPEADLSAVADYVIPDYMPNNPGDE